MKKLLVIFVTLFFVTNVFGGDRGIFSKTGIIKNNGGETLITGINIPVKTDEASLKKFIKGNFYKNFAIGENVEPKLFKAVNIDGTSIFKFAVFYKGIPVEGVYTVLTVRNDKIDRINNSLEKIDVDVSNLISPDLAVKAAMVVRNIKNIPSKFYTEKIITRHFGKFIPAYKVRFAPVSLADSRYHIVNALTGEVVKSGHSTYFDDPVNTAKIWEYNPLVTPELIEVDLPWVAPHDDSSLKEEQRGFLTTEKDSKDIIRIKSFNCPDTGEKVDITDLVEQYAGMELPEGTEIKAPMCSPSQLANKIENGSFIYDDCESGHEFNLDNLTVEKIDRCAEISMYYHASKIYSYITGLYKEIDSKNPFYLQNNDKDRPLNVIGNFTMPDTSDFMAIYQGTAKLTYFDNAFFSQDNPTIGDLLAQYGIKGDLLVFGQGKKADLGYDGDVVYHEFGHATIYTAGIVGMEFTDKYGVSNEPGSVHEGIADTFAFIMTDNSCTGEYASKGMIDSYGGAIQMDKEGDFYCMRTALNKYTVFEDFIGEVHWDGQPLLAANWDVYNLIKGKDEDTSQHRDNLTKLILKTLYAIGSGDASFKMWADTFLDEVGKDDNFKGKKSEIEKILKDRNFFEDIRARSANKEVERTFIGAANGITISEKGKDVKVGPSYLQFYYDVPENADKNGLMISASVAADSGGSMMPGGETETPEIEIYFRKGSPVEYSLNEETSKVEALKDGSAVAEGSGVGKKWGLYNIEPGNRYYFQFVNTSASSGQITFIKVKSENVEAPETEQPDEIEVPDQEASFEDDPISDDENEITTDKKKSSSGCSISIF